MTTQWTRALDEAGVVRLAELLALKLRAGDMVALNGDLGAGKTTFARALIGALLGSDQTEVPSPTFSLQQAYATPRLGVTHFDFYRLSGPDEARELGLDGALQEGAVLVEWPERASALLPADRFEIALAEAADPGMRQVTLRGLGTAAARGQRVSAVMDFLGAQPAWSGASISYLQGDASTRSYARLAKDGRTALLMDAPRQPDGPPIRGGKPYSQIAHLAEDMVRAFSGIGAALRVAGLSAPEILAEDLGRGLMLIEDLGDAVYSTAVTRGALPQEALWRAAVDALVRLRTVPAPERLLLGDGSARVVPAYDATALEIEIELLLDWYWPALRGGPAPDAIRAEFLALWRPLFERLQRQPPAWVLRDFHSPNLIWLPQREGFRRAGMIDFQDAQRGPAAYDLVSLLQDARIDTPEVLEKTLFAHYCTTARAADPAFDEAEFTFCYNALGAQRNTKILGIFVRLARRDGKPQYLAHLPRIWGYLERNLRHVTLAPLAAWYERHFPASARSGRFPP